MGSVATSQLHAISKTRQTQLLSSYSRHLVGEVDAVRLAALTNVAR
jgi:hypothetical protein